MRSEVARELGKLVTLGIFGNLGVVDAALGQPGVGTHTNKFAVSDWNFHHGAARKGKILRLRHPSLERLVFFHPLCFGVRSPAHRQLVVRSAAGTSTRADGLDSGDVVDAWDASANGK